MTSSALRPAQAAGPPPSGLEAMRLAQLFIYHHPERVSELADLRREEFDEVVRDAARTAI